MQEIKNRILSSEDGSVFPLLILQILLIPTRFVQHYIALLRIMFSADLRRIINGIYEKPKYSKLLDEYVAADPSAVAQALAHSYH